MINSTDRHQRKPTARGLPTRDRSSTLLMSSPAATSSTSASKANTPAGGLSTMQAQGVMQSSEGSEGGFETCLIKAVQLCARMHCLVSSPPVVSQLLPPAITALAHVCGRLWQVGRDFMAESSQAATADSGNGKILTSVLSSGPERGREHRRDVRFMCPRVCWCSG